MATIVSRTNDVLGSFNFFAQGGLGFLRDAYVAAEFATARQARHVRLIDDEWPDFEIDIDGQIHRFEATEADNPSRRRTDEYRNSADGLKDYPVEEWIANADSAPRWLEFACQKKAAKKYSSYVSLVIYLNLVEFGIRHKEVISSFPQATAAAHESFHEVWILWNGRAYCAFQPGGLVASTHSECRCAPSAGTK
jgi:hypothetical protein